MLRLEGVVSGDEDCGLARRAARSSVRSSVRSGVAVRLGLATSVVEVFAGCPEGEGLLELDIVVSDLETGYSIVESGMDNEVSVEEEWGEMEAGMEEVERCGKVGTRRI